MASIHTYAGWPPVILPYSWTVQNNLTRQMAWTNSETHDGHEKLKYRQILNIKGGGGSIPWWPLNWHWHDDHHKPTKCSLKAPYCSQSPYVWPLVDHFKWPQLRRVATSLYALWNHSRSQWEGEKKNHSGYLYRCRLGNVLGTKGCFDENEKYLRTEGWIQRHPDIKVKASPMQQLGLVFSSLYGLHVRVCMSGNVSACP